MDIFNQGMQNICPRFCVKEKHEQALLGASKTFPVTQGLDLWPKDSLGFSTEAGSVKSNPKSTLKPQDKIIFPESGHCGG